MFDRQPKGRSVFVPDLLVAKRITSVHVEHQATFATLNFLTGFTSYWQVSLPMSLSVT